MSNDDYPDNQVIYQEVFKSESGMVEESIHGRIKRGNRKVQPKRHAADYDIQAADETQVKLDNQTGMDLSNGDTSMLLDEHAHPDDLVG